MQTEIFKMNSTAGQAVVESVAKLLKCVEGVVDVSASFERKEVTVQFDETIASTQILQTTLSNTGFGVSKPAEKSGGCCGGCGGGGGGGGCN